MKKKIFVIIEFIIYISFIILDLLKIDSSYIKYIGIIFCLINNVLNKNLIISLASLFTLCADYFLLLKNDNYEIGLLFFIIVQLLYLLFIRSKKINPLYIFRFIFSILGILILYCVNYMFFLNILVVFYFINLLFNAISSFNNKSKIFSIGLFLFVCCDICVGLHNILNYSTLYNFISFMMWVFYLPSQVLISLGSINF